MPSRAVAGSSVPPSVSSLFAIEAKPVNAVILVGHVNEAARVDDHVLGLRHEAARLWPASLGGIGRHEIAYLARQPRVSDVVDAQTRVEVGEKHEAVVAQQRVLELVLMLV